MNELMINTYLGTSFIIAMSNTNLQMIILLRVIKYTRYIHIYITSSERKLTVQISSSRCLTRRAGHRFQFWCPDPLGNDESFHGHGIVSCVLCPRLMLTFCIQRCMKVDLVFMNGSRHLHTVVTSHIACNGNDVT